MAKSLKFFFSETTKPNANLTASGLTRTTVSAVSVKKSIEFIDCVALQASSEFDCDHILVYNSCSVHSIFTIFVAFESKNCTAHDHIGLFSIKWLEVKIAQFSKSRIFAFDVTKSVSVRFVLLLKTF